MMIPARSLMALAALTLGQASLPGLSPRHGSEPERGETLSSPPSIFSRFAFGTSHIVLGSRLFSGVSTLVDLDVDGFTDFASGGTLFLERGPRFSYVTLDENLSRKGEERFPGPSSNPTHVFPHLVVADLNEDHLPDLIAVGSHGGLATFLRTVGKAQPDTNGSRLGFDSRHWMPDATNSQQAGGIAFDTRVVRVLDLDEDGHEDLLLAGDFVGVEGRNSHSDLLWLRGDGKGSLGSPRHLLSGSVRQVVRVDIDDDGLLDLVVLGAGGSVALMTRKPSGGYLVQRMLLTTIPDADRLEVRDVDRDGIEDYLLLDPAVAGRCLDIALYKGLPGGRPGPGTKLRLTMPVGRTVASVLVEDLDVDGYPEIVVLCVDAKGAMCLEIFEGDETSSWSARDSRPLAGILASELSNAPTGFLKYEDVDGDGAPDLWVSPVREQRDGRIGILYLKSLRSSNPAIRRLGTATAAGSGVMPRISVSGGLPRIGNRRFALRASNVPGDGAPHWLWISHVQMDVSILGLHVKVFPFRTVMTHSLGSGPSGGLCRLPFPIPKDISLVGESFFFQWVFPSAGAKNPLSLARSEALQVRFLPEGSLSSLRSPR